MRPARVFLLRCWMEGETPAGAPRWQLWVEEVGPAQRGRGCASLKEAFHFLTTELAAHDDDTNLMSRATR